MAQAIVSPIALSASSDNGDRTRIENRDPSSRPS
jgi:hypothetical protein